VKEVRPARQLQGAATCKGRQEVTGIIVNMVLVNSYFHKQKNLSQNYPQFGGTRPKKNIRKPSSRPKRFKESRQLYGGPNYRFPRGAKLMTCYEWPHVCSCLDVTARVILLKWILIN